MNFKQVMVLTGLLFLSACATSSNNNLNKPAKNETLKAPVLLDQMDTQFLYMASQRALGQGQVALAIRFLSALVKKDPEAFEPRLELAELYLASGQPKQVKQAKFLMESIPDDYPVSLKGEALTQYHLLRARIMVANDEIDAAFKILSALLEREPENSDVRILLVRIHVLRGDYQQARMLILQGINNKDDLHLYQIQVQLYLQQGQTKLAEKTLSVMQGKFPKEESVVLQRSRMAEQQGNILMAEELLKMFIELHSDVAMQAYSVLAGLYVRENRLLEAIVLYQRVLPLTAGSADVYMALGKIYYQLANYSQAIKMFEQAVGQLTPQVNAANISDAKADAIFYLAAGLEAGHRWQEAIPYYNQIEEKHEFYLDAQLRLVSIDLMQKDIASAERRLSTLRQSFADRIELHEIISSLRLQQKKYKLLIKESEKAADLGFSRVLLFNRAVAFEALQKYEQLDSSLELLLSHEPKNSEALNFYGYSLADRDIRLEDAYAMVSKALELKPNDGYYLDSLAWVYFKQKKYLKAIETQLQAIKIVTDDAVMQEHLGDMYWRAGSFDKARHYWQNAIDLKHESPEKMRLKVKHGLDDNF